MKRLFWLLEMASVSLLLSLWQKDNSQTDSTKRKKEEESKMTEEIKNIDKGKLDIGGNLISDVIVKADDYAIYEIETDDIGKKLKVDISSKDKKKEADINKNFIEIKDYFIEAKCLLYRSTDYSMTKTRIANILSTALAGSPEIARERFKKLIHDIKDEYNQFYMRRILYFVPAYGLLTLLTLLVVTFLILDNTDANFLKNIIDKFFFWICLIAAAIVGGVFSLTTSIRTIKFDNEVSNFIYLIFGIERISISILAGIIIVIIMKSGIIPIVEVKNLANLYVMATIVIISAFSEKYVPSLLSGYIEKNDK